MFDNATLHALQHQGRRMRAALAECPPNRKEAGLIQRRVDDILDRRPKVFSVASDGETIYDNASPMVLSQGLMPGVSVVVNSSGEPEAVLRHDELMRRNPRDPS